MSEKTAVEMLAELDAEEKAAERAAEAEKAEAEARKELANRSAIRDAKAKHPGVALHRIDVDNVGMFLIKAPDAGQYDRFQRKCLEEQPNAKLEANQMLAEAGTVHPSAEAMAELVAGGARRLYATLAARIVELCGSDSTVKKL